MYRLIAFIFMITQKLTHAQEAIQQRISDRIKDSNFQDYLDYSDSDYSDSSLW